MNILNKLGALRKKKTPREIEGVEFNFYPVRVSKILTGEMHETINPISDAIQILLQPKNLDEEVLEEVAPDGTIARARKPMSPEMARFRGEKRGLAITAAMQKIFSDDTRYLLGKLIMDSLRDSCPSNPSDEDVAAFIDHESMTIPVFADFARGFLSANSAIFGDLGKLVKGKLDSVMASMEETPEEEPEAETQTNLKLVDPASPERSEISNDLDLESQVPPTT